MRPSGRAVNQLRDIRITRQYTMHAAGSTLIEFGNTKVICTACIEDRTPPWLKGTGKGWVTAEYGMLPGATNSRVRREAAAGKQSGRTVEIQRLIGRSLRAGVDLEALGERSIVLDCDVIQADGGTRTASITGAYISLCDAISTIPGLKRSPLMGMIAAISVGIYNGKPVLDLDYAEDSQAETDMNVIMNEAGSFVEVQGTAEGHAFRREELNAMLDLAQEGIQQIIVKQQESLA